MPSEPITPEARRIRWSAALIAGSAIAAYADSFWGDYQFDDFPAIRDNPTLLHLWSLPGPWWPPPGSLTVSGRPVLNLSLALNHAVSGFSRWSYHGCNLLVHILAGLTLFGIVRRTLERPRAAAPAAGAASASGLGGIAPTGWALAAALLWTLHPLQTEAVTYLVQRAESLMALFYLLTIYGFIRATEEAGQKPGWRAGGRIWWGLSGAACLLGMGTKEVMVSAPVAVFLYDRTFVGRSWGEPWRQRKCYYLALMATWIPLAIFVASGGGNRGGTSGFNLGMAAGRYWFSQIEAVTRYAGLTLWPRPLVFEYGPPTFPVWLSAGVLGPLWLAAAIGTVWGVARGRPWAFCATVGAMILAPTSVMPGTIQFAVEYRMYLPLAAILALVVGGIKGAAEHWPRLRRIPRTGAAIALAALAISLGAATARRNWDYRSDLALWGDTVAKRPLSAKAQGNLGMALSTRGRTGEAIAHYQEALRLNSGMAETHYNLGRAYESEDRPQDALPEFIIAARRDPTLVYAQSHAGQLLNRLGRPAEAEPYLRRALARDPALASAHGSLGVALVAEGRVPEGIQEYRSSLRLQPGQADVEFDLGIALAATRQPEEAAVHYAAAVRLGPNNPDAQLNLGVTLFQLGRRAEALAPLAAAARLRPDSADAHGNLATALEEAGRNAEALGEFRRALQLRPNYPEAHYNLGNALLRAQRLAEARAEFAEAVRLNPNFAAAREMLGRLAGFPGP
jgi:tetratricopeptide (TPR) repeat protein